MKTLIRTDKAPGAIGPYSQGIRAGTMVFTSGQLPMTADGKLETADIRAATKLCLENVKAVLESGGASLREVVKTTVFLTDLADFAAMNEVYAQFFDTEPPARSAIQVAALPRGAHIEVEAVAVIK